MPRTILVEQLGAADVMQLIDRDPGAPGSGEIRIRQSAIGVNFADIHYRRGTAPKHSMAKLPIPFTPGLEGVGLVEAVGAGVTQFQVDDRVAYASASLTIGAYAEVRLLPAELAFPLPSNISDVDAAALLYRAITVQGMIRQCYVVGEGTTILLHAAAGGIGSILSRWAHHLGATVIGTVSTNAKVARARAQGCAHVIVHASEDFLDRTLDITEGKGVDVIFDGVGIAVFERSLLAARKYGTVVSFGQASGLVPPIDPIELQHNGLYLTKFSGGTYNADLGEYHARARDVVETIQAGVFSDATHNVYPFEDVIRAHQDMEQQRTTGSIVLLT